jgi:integrase
VVASTVRGYDSVLKTHVLPTFGRAYIGSVTRDDVEDWGVGLMARDLKPSTVRNCCFVLRSMYRYALHPSRRWVRANPCDGVLLPQATTEEVRPLRPSDVAALADAVGDRYRALVYFAAYTGLRAGELGGLRVRHLNFLRSEVVVEDQVQWVQAGTSSPRRSLRGAGEPSACLGFSSWRW